MKFAHQLKEALQHEGFPPHWVESAIPYGQLKKCIKKVESELKSFGLDAETLRRLLPSCPSSEVQKHPRTLMDAPIAFQYQFPDGPRAFRPKLTLYVLLEDGIAIDASLSSESMKFLRDLAAAQGQTTSVGCYLGEECRDDLENPLETHYSIVKGQETSSISKIRRSPVVRRIEVPLMFDAEFFGLLQGDLSILDALQLGEEKAMIDEIKELGREVSRITNPTRNNTRDLDKWRELFDLYLQAGIFFSTHELDHGCRDSIAAVKQLQWFQAESTKRGIPKSFKLAASRDALNQFVNININLLRNLKFQEINQLAIAKILKKFDKRTSLGVKATFPKLIQSEGFWSRTVAKAVCAEISERIVNIVPQLDDYLCPVCFSISYKPIRLKCGHVFCIRCMIKMQQARAKFCPLCRNDVVLGADSANLDISLMNFLQRYFPKETKAKQRENEFAVAVDRWGEDYTRSRCSVM